MPLQFRDFARKEIADYYGMVTSLDACMGRILDELERTGLAENTIVCFSSDHGDHPSSQGYGTPGDAWMSRTGDPFDSGKRLPDTGMLDLGQAFSSTRWLSRAPTGYVDSIKTNHRRFETGEQESDPQPSDIR